MTRAARLVAFLSFCALALGAVACDSGTSATKAGLLDARPGGVYLALGDSIAAGHGASDAATTSYVALLAKALQEQVDSSLQLKSLSVDGKTTQDLIDGQLAEALTELRTGDVRLVTVTIGGNDLYQYAAYPDCLPDPSVAACPLKAGLSGVEERLERILGDLRAAAPDVPIAIEDYPNLFSGSGHEFEQGAMVAFGLLDEVIDRVAARHDVLVADPRPSFEGKSLELTHIADPSPDFHPNDAGHRLIADAFLKVLGLGPLSSAD